MIDNHDAEVEKLWDGLTNVPFDKREDGSLYLSRDYGPFHKGDVREEIWHWFDEQYSRGMYYLLYKRKIGEKPALNVLILSCCPPVDGNQFRIIYDDGDADTFPERAKAYFQKDVEAEKAQGGILYASWNNDRDCGMIVYQDHSIIQYSCETAFDLNTAMRTLDS